MESEQVQLRVKDKQLKEHIIYTDDDMVSDITKLFLTGKGVAFVDSSKRLTTLYGPGELTFIQFKDKD